MHDGEQEPGFEAEVDEGVAPDAGGDVSAGEQEGAGEGCAEGGGPEQWGEDGLPASGEEAPDGVSGAEDRRGGGYLRGGAMVEDGEDVHQIAAKEEFLERAGDQREGDGEEFEGAQVEEVGGDQGEGAGAGGDVGGGDEGGGDPGREAAAWGVKRNRILAVG